MRFILSISPIFRSDSDVLRRRHLLDEDGDGRIGIYLDLLPISPPEFLEPVSTMNPREKTYIKSRLSRIPREKRVISLTNNPKEANGWNPHSPMGKKFLSYFTRRS